MLAKGRFRLGQIHLEEAEKLLKRRDTPNACVHASYYAMHHCAAAALFLSGGVGKRKTVPDSHEHVIQYYSQLVELEGGKLAESAEWLNFARATRVTADYGVGTGGATTDDAAQTLRNAQAFFEAFNGKWTLEMPLDEMEDLHLTRNLEITLKKQ